MRSFTPEISWHNREPVFSVDIQPQVQTDAIDKQCTFYRVASAGGDNHVIIWRAYIKNQNDAPVEEVQVQGDHHKKPFNHIELDVVASLNLHIKTVNCAKFSPLSNMLASGGDDSYVYIWKLEEEINSEETANNQNDKDRNNPFNDFDDQYLISKEKWKRMATLRRHIEDVVDLAWSPDEKYLVTGSVDNMALVWDVKKGEVLYTLNKHGGYVQGVSWDPLNNFITTLCTDRSLRIFNAQTKKLINKTNKMSTKINPSSEEEKSKSTMIFYDDTLATISRRMSFSPNGELLMVPSGIVELDDDEKDSETDKFLNVVHIFGRDNFKKIKCYVPTGTYSTSVRFCPCLYKLKPNLNNPFPFPYRIVYAIASKHSVLVFDTQQPYPIAKVSDIHYTKLSDLSWSSDGRILIVSSTDGYCTFVLFEENELGEKYDGPVYTYQSPVKESTSIKKREKKEEKEQVEPEAVIQKVPEAQKITSFFKKLPAGTPIAVKPIAVSRTPSVKTAVQESESTKTVNQISVKKQATVSLNASKQPRRITFTTLVSKPNENIPKSPEVLKETHNTKQESESKDESKVEISKTMSMDVETKSEQVTEHEKKEQDEHLPCNQMDAKSDCIESRNQSELVKENATVLRNKRKSETTDNPEECQQSSKKRINLIQID